MRLALLATSILVLLLPALAGAQQPREGTVIDAVFETARLQQGLDLREERYREAFYLGTELYLQGEYTAALAEFRRAYRERRHADVFFAIGQCFAALGRYTEAITALRRSVRYGFSRPEMVERRVREIERAATRELEEAVGVDLEERDSEGDPRRQLLIGRSARLTCRRSSIAPESIRRVIRLRQNELRGAYERARVVDHDLAGRIVLRFAIGLDGRVGDIETVEQTLDNDAVHADVLRRFRGIQFPQRDCGDVLVVTYPLSFRPRPTNGEPTVMETRPPLVVTGALSPLLIRRTIRAEESALQEAYFARLPAGAPSVVRLVVRFNVTADGQVYRPFVSGWSVGELSSELERSILRIFESMRFPAAEGDTTVVSPIEFHRADDERPNRVLTP